MLVFSIFRLVFWCAVIVQVIVCDVVGDVVGDVDVYQWHYHVRTESYKQVHPTSIDHVQTYLYLDLRKLKLP